MIPCIALVYHLCLQQVRAELSPRERPSQPAVYGLPLPYSFIHFPNLSLKLTFKSMLWDILEKKRTEILICINTPSDPQINS